MISSAELIRCEHSFGARNYDPIPVMLSRGSGVWLWDVEGKQYLDMMSAYSAVNCGHSHPQLLAVLQQQAAQLAVVSRAFYSDQLPLFLEHACKLAGMARALPMNTGAEAVETAIKAARRWGYQVKGIADNQAEIIVANNNFHGRTTTITGFSTTAQYRKDFGPFTPGFKAIPFGDATALEQAITPNTCAFLVEPIQGEAGIIIPPQGWLAKVRDVCTRHNVLLILDEIQAGLGRTGKLFAFQHEGIHPDGLILGKSLGGGLLPIALFLAGNEVMDLFDPGSHGSTFGGNPLAAAVGRRVLRLIVQENLPKRSAELGAHFMARLQSLSSPLIKEVRGAGLWIAVEIHDDGPAARDICEALKDLEVLAKDTHRTVIRFAPPLIIDQNTLDWAFERIKQVFESLA